MARRLVLLDIDGTLIKGGTLWAECFYTALQEFFPKIKIYKTSFGGKTDDQIYREVMSLSGVSNDEIEFQIGPLKKRYIELVLEKLPGRSREVKLLPGARELVAALSEHPDAILGLLTGNLEEGARAKLDCVGLWDYFRFGVFADDHGDRYQLPRLALEKVRKLLGLEFEKKQIVIIGDTIHDVNCGRSLGVRTIAVGTGTIVHRRLVLTQNPDFYFKDLSQTDMVLEAIFEEIE
jgi:phosphoglycolate phosphatase